MRAARFKHRFDLFEPHITKIITYTYLKVQRAFKQTTAVHAML